jgi:hypothetical protein
VLRTPLLSPSLAWNILVGFLATTLNACSNYDLSEVLELDAPFDRLHSKKRNRPAAQGLVSVPVAYAQCSALSKYFDRRHNWIHIGSQTAGPKVAAIFAIVESCCRLGIPIRQYLLEVLPGLLNRSIKSVAQLTPAA